MTRKVITVEIIAFDGYEAEGINDALATTLEREDWRVYSWTTDDATIVQKEWFDREERGGGKPAPQFDSHLDYPERYTEGPI